MSDHALDQRVTTLSANYLALADSELTGYCPLYEQIARRMAGDESLLRQYVDLAPRLGVLPVLLFACVHDLVLAGEPYPTTTDDVDAVTGLATVYATGDGDPWLWFRRVLIDRFNDISHLMQSRSVQTNEVGRTAAILPALTIVHEQFGQPLALVELGPSAGLNLFLDRYGHDYGGGHHAGDPDSAVQLTCEIRGDLLPPLPSSPLPIARREGIDVNPLDVARRDDRRWLEACLWPGLPDRRARLDAAIEIARADPPVLHRGNAAELLADVIDGISVDLVPCVISTWVLSYFSPDDRHQVKATLDDVGADRPVAMITGEYPGVVGWLPTPDTPPPTGDQRGASVLGLTRWERGPGLAHPVAWMHAHGRWLDWLDESTAHATTERSR